MIIRSRDRLIRFKFMPTPSGRLHIGHAWLLFIMDTLVKAARAESLSAELIIVFDVRTSRHYGRSEQVMNTFIRQIQEDLESLGIAPDAIVDNSSVTCEGQSDAIGDGRRFLEVPEELRQPPWCFYDNAVHDTELQVTHIIRGADRRSYTSHYTRCYEMLGYECPILAYIPLVHDIQGNKVTSTDMFSIPNVLSRINLEELYCQLVRTCITEAAQCEKAKFDLQRAQQYILDRSWVFIRRDSEWQRYLNEFLSRFVPLPKFAIEV